MEDPLGGVVMTDTEDPDWGCNVDVLHRKEPTMGGAKYQVDLGFIKGMQTFNRILRDHCDGVIIELGKLGITGALVSNEEEARYTVSTMHERFPRAHFFMQCGLADRGYRKAKHLSGFNYVLVSGPAWVDRLAQQNMSPSSVLIIGYPFLDQVFIEEPPSNRELVYWSPTHSAIDEVSSYHRLDFVLLSEMFKFVAVPHPTVSGTTTRDQFRKFLPGAVIADSGSVIYEAWSLDVPVVFPDWLVKDGVRKRFSGSFEDEIYSKGIGWHATSMGEMIELLEDLTTGRLCGLGPHVHDFIEGIFPARLRGCSAQVAAQQIAQAIREMG